MNVPHNVDAEKSVLGAILANNENYFRVAASLRPEDFYLQSHRIVYAGMCGLMEETKAIDLITLQDTLLREQQLEAAGGIAYLAALYDGTPYLTNVDAYVGIIRETSTLRQMMAVANTFMAECAEASDPANDILDRTSQSLFLLSERRVQSGFVSTHDREEHSLALLDKLYRYRALVTGVASGFADLDRMTTGFQNGDLVILAARPSVGKTALALNMAHYVAVQCGLAVGIFSMEMGYDQLITRLSCAHAHVDAHKARAGYIGRDDYEKLHDAIVDLGRAHIHIDESSTLTVAEMRAKARRLKSERGLDLVVVDYLQLMTGPQKRNDSRVQEVSAITRGLKGLAKELGVPILALSQLSRAPEQRTGDHKPMLSDLRDSGSIEQDSDTVMFLWRGDMYAKTAEEMEEHAGKAELIVAKQRNGPTGTVKLAFIKHYTKFESLFDGGG